VRVIFWDLDGVLNHHGISGAWCRLWEPESLDRALVARAAALVSEVNAKCVLSSKWRVGPDAYEDTLRCLEQSGWPSSRDDFIGVTPHLRKSRGAEIEAWLSDHPEVSDFAIVDDNDDMASLRDRLILTDPFAGLSVEDCGRLRTIFS
jgi:hypothetical protein